MDQLPLFGLLHILTNACIGHGRWNRGRKQESWTKKAGLHLVVAPAYAVFEVLIEVHSHRNLKGTSSSAEKKNSTTVPQSMALDYLPLSEDTLVKKG